MLFISEWEFSPKLCITLIWHSHLNNPQCFHWHCLTSASELPSAYLSLLQVQGFIRPQSRGRLNLGYLKHYPHVTLLDIISNQRGNNLAISRLSKRNTILRELDNPKIRQTGRWGRCCPRCWGPVSDTQLRWEQDRGPMFGQCIRACKTAQCL